MQTINLTVDTNELAVIFPEGFSLHYSPGKITILTKEQTAEQQAQWARPMVLDSANPIAPSFGVHPYVPEELTFDPQYTEILTRKQPGIATVK